MNPFIRCSNSLTGEPVYINVLHIVSVYAYKGTTQIQTTGEDYHLVGETVNQVMDLIPQVQL